MTACIKHRDAAGYAGCCSWVAVCTVVLAMLLPIASTPCSAQVVIDMPPPPPAKMRSVQPPADADAAANADGTASPTGTLSIMQREGRSALHRFAYGRSSGYVRYPLGRRSLYRRSYSSPYFGHGPFFHSHFPIVVHSGFRFTFCW